MELHGTTHTDPRIALKALEEARDILDRQDVPREDRYVPNPEYIEQYYQTPNTEKEIMTESELKHLPELDYLDADKVKEADEILEQLKYNGLISKCGQYIYSIKYGDISVVRNPAYDDGGYDKNKKNIVLSKCRLEEISKLSDLYNGNLEARRAKDHLGGVVRRATNADFVIKGKNVDF